MSASAEGASSADVKPEVEAMQTDDGKGAPDDVSKGEMGSVLSIPPEKLVLIEYPGKVENASRAVRAVGGMRALEKILDPSPPVVRLHFRPVHAVPHPAFGDVHLTSSLMTRITVKRKRRKCTVVGTREVRGLSDAKIAVEVKGVVTRTVRFKGMADYQYLPPPNALPPPLTGNMNSVLKYIDSATAGRDGAAVNDQPLFLPPIVFSRFDLPRSYLYRHNPFSALVVKNDKGSLQYERIFTKKKLAGTLTRISWQNREVPQAPLPMAMEVLRRNEQALALLPKVREIFAKRPVWSRVALSLVLSPTGKDITDLLKTLLPVVAYQYTSGPYRHMYIRLGVDLTVVPEGDDVVHPVMFSVLEFKGGQRGTTTTRLSASAANPYRSRGDKTLRVNWPSPEDPIYWSRIPMTWSDYFRTVQDFAKGKAWLRHRTTMHLQIIDIKDPEFHMTVLQNVLEKASFAGVGGWLANTSLIQKRLGLKYAAWLAERQAAEGEEGVALNAADLLGVANDEAASERGNQSADSSSLDEGFWEDVPSDEEVPVL